MTHDLEDISVYACWTRLNETPEDIARMSMRFMQEFSTRIKTGPWEPLEGEWDGTEAGLVEVIKRNPITDDDGEPIPGDGYSTTLNNDRGPLNTHFNVSAGEDQLFEQVASPCFMQKYYHSEERAVLRMTRRGRWKIPFGYRVWINNWVGTIATHAEGVTTERLGNGTLIKVPDTWPAQQVVDALTETFQTNNLDEVPITW